MEKKRVLIVDDEHLPRKFATRVLDETYDVVTAADGAEALTMFSAAEDLHEPFSLVLTDVDMPGKDGIWLFEQLKSRYATLPIVFVSDDLKGKKLPTGAGLIEKPYRPDVLRELVELHLSARPIVVAITQDEDVSTAVHDALPTLTVRAASPMELDRFYNLMDGLGSRVGLVVTDVYWAEMVKSCYPTARILVCDTPERVAAVTDYPSIIVPPTNLETIRATVQQLIAAR